MVLILQALVFIILYKGSLIVWYLFWQLNPKFQNLSYQNSAKKYLTENSETTEIAGKKEIVKFNPCQITNVAL